MTFLIYVLGAVLTYVLGIITIKMYVRQLDYYSDPEEEVFWLLVCCAVWPIGAIIVAACFLFFLALRIVED